MVEFALVGAPMQSLNSHIVCKRAFRLKEIINTGQYAHTYAEFRCPFISTICCGCIWITGNSYFFIRNFSPDIVMNSLLRCGDCMPKKFLQRNCTNIDELLTGGKFYPSPPLIFRELPIILRMHQNA